MRRIYMIMVAMLCSFAAVAQTCTLSAEDITAVPGGETTYLEVKINESTPGTLVTAASFRLQLPAGVSIADYWNENDEDWVKDITYPAAKKSHNTSILATTNENEYQISVAGTTNFRITTNVLAKIGLKVPEGFKGGKYELKFSKISFANASGQSVFPQSDFKSYLTIEGGGGETTATCTISAEDVEAVAGGETSYVNVLLNESEPGKLITAASFRIQLPDGVTIAQVWSDADEDWVNDVAFPAAKASHDKRVMATSNPNEYQISVAGTSNFRITTNVFAKIGLQVPAGFKGGKYELKFTKISFANASGESVYPQSDFNAYLTVEEGEVPPATCTISAEDVDAVAGGETSYVNVLLNESDPGKLVTAASFRVQLPAGVTIAQVWSDDDEEWVKDVTFPAAKRGHDTRVIATSNENEYQISVASNKDFFRITTNVLAKIGLQIPAGLQDGKYDLKFTKISFADATGASVYPQEDFTATLNVTGGNMGTCTISVEDVTAVAGGETSYVNVLLNESDPGKLITSASFRIQLPTGISLAQLESGSYDITSPAAQGHSMAIQKISSTTYQISVTSNNYYFSATNNVLAKIGIKASATADSGDLSFTRISFLNAAGQSVYPQGDFTAKVNVEKAASCTISAQDVNAVAGGETSYLSVFLNESDPGKLITAAAFRLQLPAGVTIAKVWSDEDEDIIDDVTFPAAKKGHDTRVIATSNANEYQISVASNKDYFRTTTNVLAKIGLQVPAGLQDGKYELKFTKISFADATGASVYPQEDFTATLNVTGGDTGSCTISVEDVKAIAGGETSYVNVLLNESNPGKLITSASFRIQLPTGISLAQLESNSGSYDITSPAAQGHSLAIQKISSTIYQISVTSSNYYFSATNNVLAKIGIKASATANSGDMKFSNITFTNVAGQSVYPQADFTAKVTVEVLGTCSISAEDVEAVAGGETSYVNVILNESNPGKLITAASFRVQLPAGVTIAQVWSDDDEDYVYDVAFPAAKNGHDTRVMETSNANEYQISIASNKDYFRTTTKVLAKIGIKAAKNAKSGELKFTKISFANASGESVYPQADFTSMVYVTGGGSTEEDDTDISKLNNVIYLDKTESCSGVEAILSFKMKNRAAIRGFQFDLYLPEGVKAVKNSNGRIQGSLSSGRLPEDDAHTLTIQEQADGAIRFLCGSQYDETFTGSDGEIATLKVNIAGSVAIGEYPVVLENMRLTETNISKYYDTEHIKSTLAILSYLLGDINHDGVVNVSDYIGVANHILGSTPAGFNEKAADVNIDNLINVSDYIGIANIIMSGSPYGKPSGRAYAKAENTDPSTMDNVIYVEPMTATAGTQATLSFMMKNTADIRGFQFDLYLPEGVTAVKNAKGRIQGSLSDGRLPEDHEYTLIDEEQPDGAIRFLCASMYDETFTGNEGEVVTLQVNISENVRKGDYPIVLRNMRLSESDISEYYESDVVETTITIAGGTGIADILEGNAEMVIYNLAGQRVAKPQQGVNIVNGRKIIMK